MIVLASHGAPGKDFHPKDAIELLDRRIEKTSDQKIVLWLETELPDALKLGPEDGIENFKKAARAAGAEPTRAMYFFLRPGKEPAAGVLKTAELLNAAYAEAKNSDRLAEVDREILGWFASRRPRRQVRVQTEWSSFEIWSEFLKSDIAEYFFAKAVEQGDTRDAIEYQFDRLAHLNRHMRLRDQSLARSLRKALEEDQETLHVVVRGSSHFHLKRELDASGIAAEELRSVPAEEDRPEVVFFDKFDPEPGDLRRGGPKVREMRIAITRIIPYRFAEEYLTEKGKDFDELAYARTVAKMSEDDLMEWVQIFNDYSGERMFKKSAEWLIAKRQTAFNLAPEPPLPDAN